MQLSLLVSLLFPFAAFTANLVQSNDDGWAEINIRVFYNALISAGHKTLISSPAKNKSGRSSKEAEPTEVEHGCEFGSCPENSPAIGFNKSEPHFNYVNSYPVTAMKYGVTNLSITLLGAKPDMVVTGPNVGSNIGLSQVPYSGTAGAASAAADQLGIPGIAFSGSSGNQTAWNATAPDYSLIYADLASNITTLVIDAGAPYLPNNTWLNVNFPDAGAGTECTKVDDFKFVLARLYKASIISGEDVTTCENDGRLPTAHDVADTEGCYASISVGKADNKRDSHKDVQAVVLEKLSSILTCLP